MIQTLIAGFALFAQQNAVAVQGSTLFGEPLFGPKLSEATMKSSQENLDRALADWNADKDNVDRYVWVGRRMAYLGNFKEAAEWFREGRKLNLKGTNVQAKLLRHLGHRYISLRRFRPSR